MLFKRRATSPATAQGEPAKQGPDNAEILASIFVSMLVCLPAAACTAFLLKGHVTLQQPQILMLAILGVGIADFVALVWLDGYRRSIGPLTLPALAGCTGLVLLYLMTQGVNRFFSDFGFGWLYPIALLALGGCYLAIFREKTTLMKLYLGLNGIALTVLVCLGHADKISLPF